MTRNIKLTISIIGIIILSNTPPITGVFRLLFDSKHYKYSNFDGSFTSYEFMGRRFDSIKSMFSNCLPYQRKIDDKKLYRLFSKNPLAFWRWRLYFFDERYKLPYKDLNEIKRRREKEGVKELTGCTMDF